MGLVKLTEQITKEWEDLNGFHPYARATLCVYCDTCGSFSIVSRLGARRTLLILVTCITMIVGMLATLQFRYGFYWLGLCLVMDILAFRYLWGNATYVCRQCGSIATTAYNTLHLSPDTGDLHIPEHLTQKLYFEYFPEWYNLDNALESPETCLITENDVYQLVLQDLNSVKDILFAILLIPLLPFIAIIFLFSTEIVPKLRAFASSKRGR